MDNAELDFKLRREFGDWDDGSDDEKIKDSYGEHGDFQLVGHGNETNGYCGKFVSYKGCLNVDLHNRITLDGQNFRNKVFVQKINYSCGKPSCPICYKHGWAVREAGRIEARLKEASKHFGLVEHIVASVPVRDYGLDHNALRRKVAKILLARGVVGGVIIFHGFRHRHVDMFRGGILNPRGWYFSPHFHILGFVLGGYKCRGCRKNCVGCNGFESRTRNLFKKDGYIVKVLPKRKTVFGTAWYQLNHSSIKKGVKRFHVATWFGVCSYRKLKVTVEYKKRVCPICQHDLVRIGYGGVKHFVLESCKVGYKHCSFEDYIEDGSPVWYEIHVHKNRYGSGRYEEE